MHKELLDYINNPKSSEACFNLAEWYYEQAQWASALTYYLKCTEIDDNKDLTYFSLIKGGRGLHKQGRQTYQAKGMYLQAISIMPNRTEGYYWLSKTYTELKEWGEALAIAEIGMKQDNSITHVDLEYEGKVGLLITIANCYRNMDRIEEAIDIYTSLLKSNGLDQNNRNWCNLMMNEIWGKEWVKPEYNNNYSQAFQDLFVLEILEGKREGRYVEIGACEPKIHSNTYLLENNYNWTGISFEIDPNLVNKFNGIRENKCVWADATNYDYEEILQRMEFPKVIDYLQLDIEPAKNTFSALLSIPFDKYKFRVITYEHDAYCDDTTYRDKSRKYLESLGYELVVKDVTYGNVNNAFEDWWVRRALVNQDILDKLKLYAETNKISEYFKKNEY